MENYKQILDREIGTEMANVPFLTPIPYTPPQASSSSPIPYTPPQTTSSSPSVEDLLDYLDKETKRPKKKKPFIYKILRLKLKKLLKEIEDIYKRIKLFEVKQTDSALKKFVKVYSIRVK